MSIAEIFAKEFRKHVATFHPVWQPGDQVRVGTFGIIKDAIFVPQGHLSDLLSGLSLVVSRNSIEGSLGFHSDQGFSSKANVNANSIVSPTAEVNLCFSEAGGVYFRANDLLQESLTNAYVVLSAIDAHPMPWPDDHVFVWEVQEAREALVLISTSASWQIKASADAQAISGLNLAKAGVELTTIHGQGYSRQLPAAKERHPIALRIYGRRGFFSPSWELMGPETEDDAAPDSHKGWIEVGPDQIPAEL